MAKRKKVLIANRGEIANRILETCQSMGYQTVVIYSEADQSLPYVKKADEAILIGPAPLAESYLKMDSVIQIAKQYQVDFIHPGYGLLSENGEFADKCERNGISFVGPKSETIRAMGDKIEARKLMQEAGVPVVPGSIGDLSNMEQALREAKQIGYPIMIKASAGGGGIGMYVCHSDDELKDLLPVAKRRAMSSFGNEELFIEKYIENSRHIEVQIIGDQQGNVLHMFERDCSIQRRHQKIIEESPSPFIDEETATILCKTAVQAAQSIDYVGVGTVEFIVDEDENFYFLEMNTRLQVEHPVTEAITGKDLVELQLTVAEGQPIPFTQGELKRLGSAIECRIYAEDPVNFLPAPGQITKYKRVEGEGIRFDDAIQDGTVITPYYDPMIAKVIVHDQTRKKAIEKGKHVLREMKLEGIKNNIPFLIDVFDHRMFEEGNYTTKFVEMVKKKRNKETTIK